MIGDGQNSNLSLFSLLGEKTSSSTSKQEKTEAIKLSSIISPGQIAHVMKKLDNYKDEEVSLDDILNTDNYQKYWKKTPPNMFGHSGFELKSGHKAFDKYYDVPNNLWVLNSRYKDKVTLDEIITPGMKPKYLTITKIITEEGVKIKIDVDKSKIHKLNHSEGVPVYNINLMGYRSNDKNENETKILIFSAGFTIDQISALEKWYELLYNELSYDIDHVVRE